MVKYIKWSSYLWYSLISFSAFLLEYFSIFVIEMFLLRFDIWNYTSDQRILHHLIISFLWVLFIAGLLYFSRKHMSFPGNVKSDIVSVKNWLIAIVCLCGCKVMTFIDWNTLKVIGEFQGKTLPQFLAQYLYYFFEVGIVLLILIYGQKTFEERMHKTSYIPYGGFVLALTWGAFHFVSRGVGIELWNGISCIIFSILSGIIFVRVKQNYALSYLFIAVGYLL